MKTKTNFILIIFVFSLLMCFGCDNNSAEPDPELLRLQLIPTHVSVYGGSDGAIDLTVSGGTQPYQYQWANGETSEDLMNLSIGTYSVPVTDKDGSVKSDSTIITQPAEIKFNSEEVNFLSMGLMLQGTLNLPKDTLGIPAVIIVSGGGQDRNGILPSEPNRFPPIYKTWADTIASDGIGVLRYDQRIITPNINLLEFTLTDRVNDIVSAINYLKSRSEIDTNKIFIVSHSEGAAVAPIAAQSENLVSGVVLIGAIAFAADTFMIERLNANNATPTAIARAERLFAELRSGIYPLTWAYEGRGPLYWQQFMRYTENAGSNVINLGKPVLIIQGENDENFPPGFLYQRNTTVLGNTANQSPLIDFNLYQGVTHYLLWNGTRETAMQVIYDLINWVKQF